MSEPANPVRGQLAADTREFVFWRVEGSLLELGALRSVGYFTWNAQSFAERWARRAGMAAMALLRPFAYASGRQFATRLLHTLLCGVSRDRLELLGEEYFQYVLRPQLRRSASEKLCEAVRQGQRIVLVSQGVDHVMRPLAHHFGAEWLAANRLEFRNGRATGRLLDPVVRPRGPLAWLGSGATDGRIERGKLLGQLGWNGQPHRLEAAIHATARCPRAPDRPVVFFDGRPHTGELRVRETLAGKHILLVGVSGFIGKVWLVHLLENLPEIGKITLLLRRSRATPAQRRFGKIAEESPAFDRLYETHGERFGAFLRRKIEVVEGDVSQPGLGLDQATRRRLASSLDLVVNSAGLTDFNPDLRDALSSNVDSAVHLLEFLQDCDHAGLMHLSTCYVAGARDGRVSEELQENYNPAGDPTFDAEREIESLRETIRRVEERGKGAELEAALRRQALGRKGDASAASAGELDGVMRRNRARWVRNRLARVDLGRSIELTGLAHRKHYRSQQGIDRWLKVKLESIPVSKQRYERLSVPMQKAFVSGINRVAASLRLKKPPLAKQERDLIRIEKLIELYEPFILLNEHIFECENARLLSAALPPEERERFGFDPESIDWWDYWINIHIPALRRWCYPLMEGRSLEPRAPRAFDWNGEAVGASAASSSPHSDPLWRSS